MLALSTCKIKIERHRAWENSRGDAVDVNTLRVSKNSSCVAIFRVVTKHPFLNESLARRSDGVVVGSAEHLHASAELKDPIEEDRKNQLLEKKR